MANFGNTGYAVKKEKYFPVPVGVVELKNVDEYFKDDKKEGV